MIAKKMSVEKLVQRKLTLPPPPPTRPKGWEFRAIAILRAPTQKEWERWMAKEVKA